MDIGRFQTRRRVPTLMGTRKVDFPLMGGAKVARLGLAVVARCVFDICRKPADVCSSPGQHGGDHQGPEGRRSPPGLQGQRRLDGSPQGCSLQEPGLPHGSCICICYTTNM